jgi:hypothetical protein
MDVGVILLCIEDEQERIKNVIDLFATTTSAGLVASGPAWITCEHYKT